MAEIPFDWSRADGYEILTLSNRVRLRIIARAPKHLDSCCQDSSIKKISLPKIPCSTCPVPLPSRPESSSKVDDSNLPTAPSETCQKLHLQPSTTPPVQFDCTHSEQARYPSIHLSRCLGLRQLRLAALYGLDSNPPLHPRRPIPSPPIRPTVPNAIRDKALSQHRLRSPLRLNLSRRKR